MCRRRRTSPAQPASASITASSSRIGNKTGCFCRRSFSSAVSTSLHTHSLATECAERTRSSLSWTRMLIGGLCKKPPYCKRPEGGAWVWLAGARVWVPSPATSAACKGPGRSAVGGRATTLGGGVCGPSTPPMPGPWVSSPALACLLPAHPETGRPRVLGSTLVLATKLQHGWADRADRADPLSAVRGTFPSGCTAVGSARHPCTYCTPARNFPRTGGRRVRPVRPVRPARPRSRDPATLGLGGLPVRIIFNRSTMYFDQI